MKDEESGDYRKYVKDIDLKRVEEKPHSYKSLENPIGTNHGWDECIFGKSIILKNYCDTTVHMEDSGEFEAGSYGVFLQKVKSFTENEYGK